MPTYTQEQITEMARQKLVLFQAVRAFKRQHIGNGPPGSVKVNQGTAVSYLMTNWPDDLDPQLRNRAVQKMKNRQFIND